MQFLALGLEDVVLDDTPGLRIDDRYCYTEGRMIRITARFFALLAACIALFGAFGLMTENSPVGATDASSSAEVISAFGFERRTLDVSRTSRDYMLYTPRSAETMGKRPLVLVFHGGEGTPQKIAQQTGFNELADEEGFLVAYPRSSGHWNDGRQTTRGFGDDVAFTRALVRALVAEAGVDPRRVYATGASNGGMMTLRLACEANDVISGFAPVVASFPASYADQCEPRRPVDILLINGREDRLIRWGGGEIPSGRRRGVGGRVIPVPDTVGWWRQHNGCGEPLRELLDDQFDDGTRVARESHNVCERGGSVTFYDIAGGGHTWPGTNMRVGPLAGRVSRELSASRLIWEFFSDLTAAETQVFDPLADYGGDPGPFLVAPQQVLQLDGRSGARELSVRVTYPQDLLFPAPVIIFSHGVWGSADQYQPLIRHWASHGYVCLQPQHGDTVPEEQRGLGTPGGAFGGLTERIEEISRVIDAVEVLPASWADLDGVMDSGQIGVAGHSFGAHVAQLMGGTRLKSDGRQNRANLQDPRIDAVVMLAPRGRGAQLDEASWQDFRVPFLAVTGSNDVARLRYGEDVSWRLDPFRFASALPRYLLFINDGYNNFGGLTETAIRFTGWGEPNAVHARHVLDFTTAFWDAELRRDAVANEYLKQRANNNRFSADAEIMFLDNPEDVPTLLRAAPEQRRPQGTMGRRFGNRFYSFG